MVRCLVPAVGSFGTVTLAHASSAMRKRRLVEVAMVHGVV